MSKTIAVVGVGYVGINLASAFSSKFNVIGYDVDKEKIEKLSQGIDVTGEIKCDLKSCNISFTYDATILKSADVIIVTVPTPTDKYNKPDLFCIIEATKTIAKNMKKGVLVIYESTVVPGTTSRLCRELLEMYSDLKCEDDFMLGYSPERINPGDDVHTIYNSTKIISGTNAETTNMMKEIYSMIINDVYVVDSIEIAEAAKLIENTQRDINIAFMNQMVQYLTKKDIPRKDVFDAMKTKWNSLGFTPGLVGGHCIGIDPYYLINDACENQLSLSLVEEARNINENVSHFIVDKIMTMIGDNVRVGILGFSYKKDSNDIRNTKVYDIYSKLVDKGISVCVSDYNLRGIDVMKQYNVNFVDKLSDVNLVILAVPHSEYVMYDVLEYKNMFKNDANMMIYDIYNVLDVDKFKKNNIIVEGM